LFNFGFAIFGVASLLCGFAQPRFQALDLVLYRALMGIGAGFIFSNSAPILADKFHPYGQMGLAQGLWQIAFALGSVIGPVVGGGLLQAGWPWIFWFNVPFCAVGCVFGFWQVKDYIPPETVESDGHKKPQVTLSQVMRRFDYLGCFLLVMSIISLFIAVVSSIFPTEKLGKTATIAFAVVCGACAVLFLIWDYIRRNNTPFVDFKMFDNRTFTLSTVGNSMAALARGGLTFAFIFLYQGPFGDNALQAGIDVIPFGVGMVLAGYPSGKLGDVYGYKPPAIVGPLISALGLIGAAFIKLTTNYWVTAAYLFFAGLGAGVYNSPISAIGMLAVPPSERGQSSGVRMMLTMVANAISIVICFSLIVGNLPAALVYKLFIIGGGGLDESTAKPFMDGFHYVIWILVAANLVAALCSIPLQEFRRPKKRAPATASTVTTARESVEFPNREGPSGEPMPDIGGHREHQDLEQPEPLPAPLEGLDANQNEDYALDPNMPLPGPDLHTVTVTPVDTASTRQT
jgi:MFS family permease